MTIEDLCFKTKHEPRISQPRKLMAAPNSVRAWRDSPFSITLQLRTGHNYVSVVLTPDEAQVLAEHIGKLVESFRP